jgi:hypothetical protein
MERAAQPGTSRLIRFARRSARNALEPPELPRAAERRQGSRDNVGMMVKGRIWMTRKTIGSVNRTRGLLIEIATGVWYRMSELPTTPGHPLLDDVTLISVQLEA